MLSATNGLWLWVLSPRTRLEWSVGVHLLDLDSALERSSASLNPLKISSGSETSAISTSPEKPVIEWIVDRYQLTKDKDSGILNNPNDWATEHSDLQDILNLLKRIVTVSIDTMKIVNALPTLNERTR